MATCRLLLAAGQVPQGNPQHAWPRTRRCMPLRPTLPGGTEGSVRNVKTLQGAHKARQSVWYLHRMAQPGQVETGCPCSSHMPLNSM